MKPSDEQPYGQIGQCQRQAICHVAGLATGGPLDGTVRVTVNFHPQARVGTTTVLAAMVRDGQYRNQFETGVTSGDPSAFVGGGRWLWESEIFGGAYDCAPAAQRPKYGSLNFRHQAAGGAPRFGAAHLRLRPETLHRTTFCYPDSAFGPEDFGVAAKQDVIRAFEKNAAKPRARDEDYIDYVEAQLHGALVLSRDVEAIVLDPCYEGTDVEKLARDLPCALEWHGGFAIDVGVLKRYPRYREASYAKLGASLAQGGRLDARIVWDAAVGSYDEQALRRVWHYVAWFGERKIGDER